MKSSESHLSGPKYHACCPSHDQKDADGNSISRRKFIKVAGGTTLSVAALSGLSWSVLANTGLKEHGGLKRHALVVKPILVYSAPEYRHRLCSI